MVQQMNWGYINFRCRINALSKYGQHENKYSDRYWKLFLFDRFFDCRSKAQGYSSTVLRPLFDCCSTLLRR
jgi:hypothetical protein